MMCHQQKISTEYGLLTPNRKLNTIKTENNKDNALHSQNETGVQELQ